MAYVQVPQKVDGDLAYDADFLNTYLKSNLAAMAPDVFSAKGDLFAATGADTGARLAVGSDGQILTAESLEATGLKWASAAHAMGTGSAGNTTLTANDWVDIVNITSDKFDPAGALDNLTRVFTANISGYYLAECKVTFLHNSTVTTININDIGCLALYKNGSLFSKIGLSVSQVERTALTYFVTGGMDLVYLAKGDTANFKYFTDDINRLATVLTTYGPITEMSFALIMR